MSQATNSHTEQLGQSIREMRTWATPQALAGRHPGAIAGLVARWRAHFGNERNQIDALKEFLAVVCWDLAWTDGEGLRHLGESIRHAVFDTVEDRISPQSAMLQFETGDVDTAVMSDEHGMSIDVISIHDSSSSPSTADTRLSCDSQPDPGKQPAFVMPITLQDLQAAGRHVDSAMGTTAPYESSRCTSVDHGDDSPQQTLPSQCATEAPQTPSHVDNEMIYSIGDTAPSSSEYRTASSDSSVVSDSQVNSEPGTRKVAPSKVGPSRRARRSKREMFTPSGRIQVVAGHSLDTILTYSIDMIAGMESASQEKWCRILVKYIFTFRRDVDLRKHFAAASAQYELPPIDGRTNRELQRHGLLHQKHLVGDPNRSFTNKPNNLFVAMCDWIDLAEEDESTRNLLTQYVVEGYVGMTSGQRTAWDKYLNTRIRLGVNCNVIRKALGLGSLIVLSAWPCMHALQRALPRSLELILNGNNEKAGITEHFGLSSLFLRLSDLYETEGEIHVSNYNKEWLFVSGTFADFISLKFVERYDLHSLAWADMLRELGEED